MKSFFAALVALSLTAVIGAETYSQAMKAGQQNRSKRKYTEAAEAYVRAEKLAANPRAKWNATFYIGVSQVLGKKADEGIATLRKSLEIAPDEKTKGQSQYHIGYYLMTLKKYDQAVPELQKVAGVLNGKDQVLADRSNQNIARIYFIQKKYKEAYDLALATTKSKVTDVAYAAWNTCFDSAVRTKDKAKAKDALDKMSALIKDSKVNYYRYHTLRQTYIYYSNIDRNPEKALEAADKIESDKKFNKHQVVIGTYYKAITYSSMRKPDLAKAQWQKLEKCGLKFFENAAKKNLERLNKK